MAAISVCRRQETNEGKKESSFIETYHFFPTQYFLDNY